MSAPIRLVMRRTAWLRLKLRSLDNWRRGFAYGPVRRCRKCSHTVYSLPCSYCASPSPETDKR